MSLLLIIAIAFIAWVAGGVLLIASLNVLFGLHIPYEFMEIASSMFIVYLLSNFEIETQGLVETDDR